MLSSRKSQERIPWLLLGVEALIVVLSVLLALGLDSWREGRAEHKLALRSLQDVVDETDVNCSLIRALHDYHHDVAEGKRAPEGIRIGMIRNDAWKSAQSTGAATHIDYDIAARIGKIHASQSDHRTLVRSYAQALFMSLGAGVQLDEVHGDLDIAVMRDMARIQVQLLDLYQELEDLVQERHGSEIETGGFCRET